MKRLILSLAIALMTLTALAADNAPSKSTIHFKSGEYVTGVITARDDVRVELLSDDGIKYVYTTDEIDYISHERKKKNYDTSRFRGFIDLGYAMGVGAPRGDYWMVETSFGAMVTPRVYLGAGVGVHKFKANLESFPMRYDRVEPELNDPKLDKMPFFPVYADVRYNLGSENSNTLWADLRLGASIFNHVGVYAAPSVGYHFASSQFFSFNIGLGYALHTTDYKLWCRGEVPGAIPDANGGAYLKKTAALHNLFVRLGVEF